MFLWLILGIISIFGNMTASNECALTLASRCLIWIWIWFIDRWLRGFWGFAELRLSTREPNQKKTPWKRRLWWRAHEQNEITSVRLLQFRYWHCRQFFNRIVKSFNVFMHGMFFFFSRDFFFFLGEIQMERL